MTGRAPRPRLVVFGIGNPSRGDDALGPLLLERLEGLSAPWVDIECVPVFQLQIENVLDLVGRDLALFLDAAVSGPAPFALAPVEPPSGASFTTHALAPGALLAVFRQTQSQPPPPAFTLAVRGLEFGLGEGLSAAGARHLEAAWAELRRLVACPQAAAWRGAREASAAVGIGAE